MKVFIITPDDSPKSSSLISVISAFVNVEYIGVANDVVEAISDIQRRHPKILLFNSGILEEEGHDCLTSILEARYSFIMMPKQRQFKGRCIYIGLDFSDSEQKRWVFKEIWEILREHHRFTAK